MTLSVDCQAQYLTGDVDQMRGVDYDATCLVKAAKGLSLNNQYVWADVAGRRVKIAEANKDLALDSFGEWGAARIKALYGDRKVVLIPVPSSKTVISSPPDFRTARMANKIAEHCNAVVHPALRFKKEMSSTREGGPREPELIYPEMTLTSAPPTGPVVLIDDVLTTGGHLVASSWVLDDIGREPSHAMCCGRTVHERLNDPFVVPTETLATVR